MHRKCVNLDALLFPYTSYPKWFLLCRVTVPVTGVTRPRNLAPKIRFIYHP